MRNACRNFRGKDYVRDQAVHTRQNNIKMHERQVGCKGGKWIKFV